MPQLDHTLVHARADDRIALAKQRGYLVTTQARGCMAWLDECRLRRWPFVVVVHERRHWRLRIEMGDWRLTDFGQRLITDLLAEHGATQITVLPDAVYGHKLSREVAELIAGRLIADVRERLSELQSQVEVN